MVDAAEGEAYRDAGMRIIKLHGEIDGKDYTFRKLNYAKLSCE